MKKPARRYIGSFPNQLAVDKGAVGRLPIPYEYKGAVLLLVVNDNAVDLEMVPRDGWVLEDDVILVLIGVSAKLDCLVWKDPKSFYVSEWSVTLLGLKNRWGTDD